MSKSKKTQQNNKYKILADHVMSSHQHLQAIYADDDATTPRKYAEWVNDAWVEIRRRDLSNGIVDLIDQTLEEGERPNSTLGNVLTMIDGKIESSNMEDWDISTNSLPLKTSGQSVHKSGEIIKSPQSDLMLATIPVEVNEIPTEQEFKAGRTYKLLTDWLSPDKLEYLQVALGQALIGNPEHVILMIFDKGRNGKSLFLRYLEETFGKYTTTIDAEHVTINKYGTSKHSAGLMPLRFTRFALIGELESASTRLAGGKLKTLTGGDSFQANLMRQNPVNIRSLAMPIIFGNHDPILEDASVGIKERIKYIHFDRQFTDEEKIPEAEITEIIESERGHFLHWILEGLKKYTQEGLKVTEQVRADTQGYLGQEDQLSMVMNAMVTPDKDSELEIKAIYDAMESSRNHVPGITGYIKLAKELRQRDWPCSEKGVGVARLFGYRFAVSTDRFGRPN